MKEKREKMKKIAAVVLCGAVAVSAAGVLGGCGSQAQKKPSISVSIFDRGQVAADEGSYEDNRWTKYISEKSGIDVKWIPIPRNEVRQKLNMLIASGDAPDLMWDYDRDYIAQLVEQEALMPVGDVVEQNSTAYKAYLEKNPELKPYVTFEGEMYAITSKRPNVANYGAWIRKDWLDKLGLSMPKTDEELLQVARAFRDGDPDGNGQADTIPIALSGNDLIPNFYQVSKNSWYLNNGNMEYGALTDRFTDAIRFKQQCYQEGLIDPEFITDTNNQIQQQNLTGGKSGIYLNAWDIKQQYVTLKQNDPEAELVPMEAISTKYGQSAYYQETPANRYVVFNANCKNPEVGMQFLDWMLTDGWFPVIYGEEGVHYKKSDGAPIPLDEEKNKKEIGYSGEYAVINQDVLYPDKFEMMAAGGDAATKAYAAIRKTSLESALRHPFRRDLPYNPSFPEFAALQSEMDTLIDSIVIEATIGKDNMTPEMASDRIKQEWKRLGGEDVQIKAQKWYEENKENLK